MQSSLFVKILITQPIYQPMDSVAWGRPAATPSLQMCPYKGVLFGDMIDVITIWEI